MISNVYNVDCIDYMKSIPDGFFDLAVADPPYGSADGVNHAGGGQVCEIRYNRFGGRFQRYIPREEPGRQNINGGGVEWDIAPPEEWFTELFRVSKNQIIWGGNYFSLPPTRCFLIWKKLSISEDFSMAMAEYAWTSFFGNAKVFECPPQGKKSDTRFHPTQKPTELYSWIFRLFGKTGMRVFDPMMGSQSSRIAAYFAGLDYWGCEINKGYFDKGNIRFEKICNGVEEINGHTIEQKTLF